MNRPQLSDFNLTEKDLEKNKLEIEEYKAANNKHCEQERETFRSTGRICFIIGGLIIVALIVVSSILKDGESKTPWQVILAVAAMAVIGLGIYKYNATPTSLHETRYVNQNLKQRIADYNNALNEYNNQIIRLQRDYWNKLNGYQFEEEIAKLYRKLGYTASVTRKSGDGGVDIVLHKDDAKIAVQCKHHSNKVGPNDIRALQGVVATQNFDYGIFVSLNGFTATVADEVRRSSDRIKIELVSITQILKMCEAASGFAVPKPVPFKPLATAPYKAVTHAPRISGEKIVSYGSVVTVYDFENDEEETYTILGKDNVDISENIISDESPVGSALLFHKTNEVVTVSAPEGKYKLIIKSIR